ncbi:hypothetical protein DFH06DRAFT_1183051 [Mycena polygramma]|nr:hypothetical protein DFH06DRAFT_1183051 [Mycena polygramma]
MVPSVSRTSSSRNRTEAYAVIGASKAGTIFAALPVELRVEVFLQFCGIYCHVGKFAEGPIMLLRICRAWTDLVLQTPQLWSSFAVDFRQWNGQGQRFLISAMKRWIERSRNFPLSFKLHYPILNGTCTDVVQCIIPTVARWRNVTLYAPTDSLVTLWQAAPNTFPPLELSAWKPSVGTYPEDHYGPKVPISKLFILGYLPIDSRQLLESLRVVPALRSLSVTQSRGDIERDFIDNAFFGALTEEPGCGDGLIPCLQRVRLESHGESFSNIAFLRFVASRWRYQESFSTAGQLEYVDFISPKRHAEYRPMRFKDVKEGRLDVSAGLRSESSMVQVLSSFLKADSYGRMICFMNGDFPMDIRPLLVFS